MVGWHHRLDAHEFEQAPGVGDGQGSLASCSPWGRKESDTTGQQLKSQRFCTDTDPSWVWSEIFNQGETVTAMNIL